MTRFKIVSRSEVMNFRISKRLWNDKFKSQVICTFRHIPQRIDFQPEHKRCRERRIVSASWEPSPYDLLVDNYEFFTCTVKTDFHTVHLCKRFWSIFETLILLSFLRKSFNKDVANDHKNMILQEIGLDKPQATHWVKTLIWSDDVHRGVSASTLEIFKLWVNHGDDWDNLINKNL